MSAATWGSRTKEQTRVIIPTGNERQRTNFVLRQERRVGAEGVHAARGQLEMRLGVQHTPPTR